MLVLTRKPREEIRIGNGITITILRVKGQQVRVGIEAPNDVRIVRGELEENTDSDDSESKDRSVPDTKVAGPLSCTATQSRIQSDAKPTPSKNPQCQSSITTDASGSEGVVSHCRIERPAGGNSNSMLQILAERQRAKAQLNQTQLNRQSLNSPQLPPR